MHKIIKYIFQFHLFLFFNSAFANNIYHLNPKHSSQDIKPAHYCDSSEKTDINQIQKLGFKKFKSSSVNLAYTNLPHWFTFSYCVENSDENYYLHFENPLLDSIEVYIIQKNRIIQKLTFGDHYNFKKRSYNLPDFLIKLPNKKQEVIDVYIKIKSDISLLSPIKIYSESALISEFNDLLKGTGIYYGALMIIFFYYLLIFISLKDRAYLFYILYLLFYGLSLFNFDGYMFKYLLPDSPKINNLALYVCIYLATIFGGFFATAFLDLKKTWRYGFLLIQYFLIPVFICLALIIVYPNVKFHDIASSLLAALLSLIGIIIGIVSWTRNYPSAKYYLLAYTFVLSSVIVYVFKDLGLLPSTSFTEYIMHFGSGIEMILLSLGLADKYKKLKEINEESQIKIIENLKEIQMLQNQTNQELEEKVNAKTKEIILLNKQITEKEKTFLMAEMSSLLSHELNTPLANIKNASLGIKETFEQKSTINNNLDSQINSSISERLKDSIHSPARLLSSRIIKKEEAYINKLIEKHKLLNLKLSIPEIVKLNLAEEEMLIALNNIEGVNNLLNMACYEKSISTFVHILSVGVSEISKVVEEVKSIESLETNDEMVKLNLFESINFTLKQNPYNFEFNNLSSKITSIELFGHQDKLTQLWNGIWKITEEYTIINTQKSIVLELLENKKRIQLLIDIPTTSIDLNFFSQNFDFNSFTDLERSLRIRLSIIKTILEEHHAKMNFKINENKLTYSIEFLKLT
jgi:signal transduction histidine kinase